MIRIDEPDIILPGVIKFHFIYFTKDFTPMFLVKDRWQILFTELDDKRGLQISNVCCTLFEGQET